MKFKRILTLFSLFALFSCTATPDRGFQVANKKLERGYAPVRIVTKSFNDDSYISTTEWAGQKGLSITNRAPKVRADVFLALNKRCGFESEQLLETRIVRHEGPLFYEVWIFDDPMSGRDDKESGVSVVMKQLPNGAGVDFGFYGMCHSAESPEFVSVR